MEIMGIRTLIMAGAAGLVMALGSAATNPEPLEADDCSGPGSVVCKSNESCINILFYSQCTTNYDYWNEDEEEEEVEII